MAQNSVLMALRSKATAETTSPAPEAGPSTVISSAVITRPRNLARKTVHKLLHAPVLFKAQVIFAIVLLGSAVQALDILPETVVSDKHNPVNKYLAKFSWLWTLLWLVPTVSCTGALYSALALRGFLSHLSRIAVGHAMWYSVTSFIQYVDNYAGSCSLGGISNARACRRDGHEWNGFDISGHIFLLSYCVFVITEEAANIKLEVWNEYRDTLTLERQFLAKRGKLLEKWLFRLHHFFGYFVEALEVYALALLLIWMSMVVVSSLFFHTVSEKLLGYGIAVGVWFGTYGFIYGKAAFLPCQPNFGVLHPSKHLTIQTQPKFNGVH